MYLAGQDLPLTRSMAKGLIDDGLVAVGGKRAKASHHVLEGEQIEVAIPEPQQPLARPEDIPLDIIYEDSDIIVVNKSADMVVHPAVGNYGGTLVNALLYHCKDLSGVGGELKPGIVHRLDKGTSGVIVAAKNDEAHLSLSSQFKDRTVTKIYGALVYGVPAEKSGVIDKPIGRSLGDRKKMSTRTKKGRLSLTEYTILEAFGRYISWLEINLGTGRTHQIRVHMTEMGHPLVGDPTYGRGGVNRLPKGAWRDAVAGFDRPSLHAWRLTLYHPLTGERMTFEAPLPDDLQQLLKKLRKID